MAITKLGVLHPGEMGISVAATAQNSGCRVYWASEGRSASTRARAEKYGMIDAVTLAGLCDASDAIVSVCPPHAAEEVAAAVRAAGFHGLYLDANAISPQRVLRMAEAMAEAGIDFVDGGIIGGPAWQPGTTWLYLAGPRAAEAAQCFASGPLETRLLGEPVGRASALKMCFAAYTKGTTALLCAILAAAEQLGVRDDLYRQWGFGDEAFAGRTEQRVRGVTSKAWRYAGEMEEISATFRDAGLPGDFHAGAAEIYRRLAGYKDAQELPPLEEVIEALVSQDSAERTIE